MSRMSELYAERMRGPEPEQGDETAPTLPLRDHDVRDVPALLLRLHAHSPAPLVPVPPSTEVPF